MSDDADGSGGNDEMVKWITVLNIIYCLKSSFTTSY